MLDAVESWSEAGIRCRSARHHDPSNPLRRDGKLPAIAGAEFCLQAAALHGALLAGGAQPPGYVASLRAVSLAVDRLDDPLFAFLVVEATREAQQAFGMIYDLRLCADGGPVLLTARATIKLPS